MRPRFDVVIVGHATRDIECVGDGPLVERPGGVALFAGVTAARLGADTAVLTRAPNVHAVHALRDVANAGAEVIVRPSPTATVFVNTYPQGIAGPRIQRVTAIATPFLADDLRNVRARAIVLGPLTRTDFDAPAIASARAACDMLVLGAQGLVRAIGSDGEVTLVDPGALPWLADIDVIACDVDEAHALTGISDPALSCRELALRSRGEALVTAGPAGAWLATRDTVERITPAPLERITSPTGAGDIFLAAYVVARLRDEAPIAAARFATTVTARALTSA